MGARKRGLRTPLVLAGIGCGPPAKGLPMGVRLFQEPSLDRPVLIASWPGIGNVGIIAVDTFRAMVGADELGEIEPWDFFYPNKVVIRDGELKDLQFPKNRFYFKKTERADLLFFLGEEQPAAASSGYAEGASAYRMANLVLDVALKFGARRIYTSGAAVAAIHHTTRSRVWAVPNLPSLLPEVRGYENTVLMSDVEGMGGQGNITGLNGLLLGVAKKRGVEAICVMGEIPAYLHNLPLPYPKASQSVLEVLVAALGLPYDFQGLAAIVERSEREIDALYESFPEALREQIDKLRRLPQAKPAEPEPITEEDKQRIMEDIDLFFKRERKDD